MYSQKADDKNGYIFSCCQHDMLIVCVWRYLVMFAIVVTLRSKLTYHMNITESKTYVFCSSLHCLNSVGYLAVSPASYGGGFMSHLSEGVRL